MSYIEILNQTSLRKMRALIFILFFIIFFFFLYFLLYPNRYREYIFPGIEGPKEVSVLPLPIKADWREYQHGSLSRLAIWLTEEEYSNWLGLANGLKTIGLPFLITTDLDQALQHRVLMIYPDFSTKDLVENARNKLEDFVNQGGTLIGLKNLSPLKKLFGLDYSSEAPHQTVTFLNGLPFENPLSDPADKTIIINTLTNRKDQKELTKTEEYYPQGASIIAEYDNHQAAIIEHPFGKGKAVAIGIDLGFFTSKSYGMRQNVATERYANRFTPSVEALLFYVARLYQENESNAILLKTTPHRYKLAVLFSHDVDWSSSLKNSVEYAKYEHEQGVKGTYFMQVKYIRDALDEYFFDGAAVSLLQKIRDLEMEIASHSVSHSLMFASFPIGTGKEAYPSYRPINISTQETINGTIFGELRVSKFLLDQCVGKINVQSFRPGYLERPPQLPEALEACHYLYSSTITSNNAYTHLPFPMYYQNNYRSNVNVFEFPISLEDILPPKMGDRIAEGIELGKKLSAYGACCMILIHPDVLDHKFAFEKQFTEAFKQDAWFPSLVEYGSWWAARHTIEVDVKEMAQHKILSLQTSTPIKGLNLSLPSQWRFVGTNPSNIPVSQGEKDLVIDHLEGKIELLFEI